VSHLAFPALAPERNHHADTFPLAPLGNQCHRKDLAHTDDEYVAV
ncbi:MAG: hypothetical protein H0S77_09305, partial [Spirochaetaceae bacterium]|nr:hypothetical protein [Spirochaetaceae bacterium]